MGTIVGPVANMVFADPTENYRNTCLEGSAYGDHIGASCGLLDQLFSSHDGIIHCSMHKDVLYIRKAEISVSSIKNLVQMVQSLTILDKKRESDSTDGGPHFDSPFMVCPGSLSNGLMT